MDRSRWRSSCGAPQRWCLPGPACYGLGGAEPTVTDASVVLGLLAADATLSGGLALDSDAASAAVGALGERTGLDAATSASGILAIAASSMANAVRAVTTERGLDPRDFTLVAYGGNGPLHVSLVARELGIREVVIPQAPAVFSAVGMLMADVRRDTVRTNVQPLARTDGASLERDFRALEDELRGQVTAGKVSFETLSFVRAADMRYTGQEHTVTVAVRAGLNADGDLAELKRDFDAAHEQRFSHSASDEPAEIVSVRVSALGGLRRPSFPPIQAGASEPDADALIGAQDAVAGDDDRPVEVPVYERAGLRAGNQIAGPAIIREPTTSTLLRAGDRLMVDGSGNLRLTIGTSL